jgi:dTDP-D-glucose 4,6-dehydratase
MSDRSLPIYGDGLNIREWIFADEHSRAVWLALERGRPGEVYNIGSGQEKTNLDVVRAVLKLLGKPNPDYLREGSPGSRSAVCNGLFQDSARMGMEK